MKSKKLQKGEDRSAKGGEARFAYSGLDRVLFMSARV